jgi:hypothetical protein
MNEFNRFTDIEHRPLRIYNRVVMFHNIFEDHGKAVAEDYANTFNKEERLEMVQMTSLVRGRGAKYVKDMVTRNIDFPEYPSEVTYV